MDIAAYGWEHPQWLGAFYPEDMPEEWRLDYYCNEFSSIVVPSGKWCRTGGAQVDGWASGLGEQTRVYLELPPRLRPETAKEAEAALSGRLAGFVAFRRLDTVPEDLGVPVGFFGAPEPPSVAGRDVGWCWPEEEGLLCSGSKLHCAWVGCKPLTPMDLRRFIEALAAGGADRSLMVSRGVRHRSRLCVTLRCSPNFWGCSSGALLSEEALNCEPLC